MVNTRVAPAILAAVNTAGSGAEFPEVGVTTIISSTPATCAGTTVIITVDTSGAVPAGTYAAIEFNGVILSPRFRLLSLQLFGRALL